MSASRNQPKPNSDAFTPDELRVFSLADQMVAEAMSRPGFCDQVNELARNRFKAVGIILDDWQAAQLTTALITNTALENARQAISELDALTPAEFLK